MDFPYGLWYWWAVKYMCIRLSNDLTANTSCNMDVVQYKLSKLGETLLNSMILTLFGGIYVCIVYLLYLFILRCSMTTFGTSLCLRLSHLPRYLMNGEGKILWPFILILKLKLGGGSPILRKNISTAVERYFIGKKWF